MKIVITGANSFIGKHLADKAASCGDELTLVMREEHENESFPQAAKRLYLDFCDYGQLGRLIGECDCFVHLAWSGTRGESRMDVAMQEKNVQLSLAAVKSMLDVGCRRIITAGSQAEYGPHMEQITEESECRPNTEYGKAKLRLYYEVEKLCKFYVAGYKEPRFFSLYGPGDYEGTMVMSMLRKMIDNQPCELTQGIQKWDFLYIDDAIEALYKLCTVQCPNGVYNLGSGDTRTLKDYILEMADITKTKSELRFGSIPYPETGMVSIWPDVSRLMESVGWIPEVSFKEGIESVIKHIL